MVQAIKAFDRAVLDQTQVARGRKLLAIKASRPNNNRGARGVPRLRPGPRVTTAVFGLRARVTVAALTTQNAAGV